LIAFLSAGTRRETKVRWESEGPDVGNEVQDRELGSCSTTSEKPLPVASGHKLGSARGLLLGVALGALFWTVVIFFIRHWWV
jgi:hypothetical protein